MSIVVRDDWKLAAACRGHDDPDLWVLGFGPPGERHRTALAICAGCPVKQRCYQYGVDTNASGMIYGGVGFGTRAQPPGLRVVEQIRCLRCKAVSDAPRKGRKKFCGSRCRLAYEADRRRAERALQGRSR